MNVLICIGCKKHPNELEEYIFAAKANDMTPDDFVRQEEGTLNRTNGHFACTPCYAKMGMPTSPTGWKAP